MALLAAVGVLGATLAGSVAHAPSGGAWASSGQRVAGSGTAGSASFELSSPRGVALDVSGALYVADTANNRVQKWVTSGNSTSQTTVAGTGVAGSAANQLNKPAAVLVDGSGNLYVADTSNNRVQKFPPGSTELTGGTTVAGTGVPGAAANQLYKPTALALDASGNLYVADPGNNRVQKFPSGSTSSTNATTVAGSAAGTGGSASNALNGPQGVAVDPANNAVFVADTNNQRVQKWLAGATSGTTVAGATGTAGSAANLLSGPAGVFLITVGGVQSLYVADTNNNRVQRWLAGATAGTTAAGGNGAGSALNQLSAPSGVVVDGKGNVFVADNANHRVQKWVGVPNAPTAVVVTVSPSGPSASVAFTAPDQGGSPVSAYTATCTSSTGGTTRSNSAAASPVAVGLLTQNATYTCAVKATNLAGDSNSSALSASFVAPGVPCQITALTATAGNGIVGLSWAAPCANGAALTSYDVRYAENSLMTTNVGQTSRDAAATGISIGLTNGKTYFFQVRAVNGVGAGPWGPTTPVSATPKGPPYAPSVSSTLRNDFGSVQVTAAPNAQGDGGSPITRYTFTASPGGQTCVATAPATSCSITGLTGGTDYTFTATASNTLGTSVSSSPSSALRAVGRTQFATSANVTNTNVLTLTPNSAASVPVGARLLVYVAADTVSSSAPSVSGVTFPGGGAATCSSWGGNAGGTATAGTGAVGTIASCAVTTAIPSGGTVRVTLTATTAKAVAIGEYIVGFPSGGSENRAAARTGVGSVPLTNSLAVTANTLLIGAVSYENGTSALTSSDTSWRTAMRIGNGTTGSSGITISRQYKFPTTSASGVTYSTSATSSGEDWAALIFTIS